MCIAVWVWQAHPHYPLLLLLNRDENHNRPTKPVSWWEDSSNILGGRDCLAGGTWLGCTRDGRLAFLTNFREPHSIPEAKSRGELPVRFLESDKSPREFAEEVLKEADNYNGFNLILADLCSKTMIYVSNRPKGESFPIQEVSPGIHVLSNAKLDTPWHKSDKSPWEFAEEVLKEADNYNGFNLILADLCSKTVIYVSNRPKGESFPIQEVSPGIHVLSNAKLDTPWHKAQRLRQNFDELLNKYGEEVPVEDMVEQLMTDTVRADEEKLPNTGWSPEWELILSSIFIDTDTPKGRCGTRSMAALSMKVSGEISFYEKYLEENVWNKHTIQYQIENVH